MKSPLTILTLVFTVMFSSTSFAEWMKFGSGDDSSFYIDVERIRKHDGYVYFWSLADYSKPETAMKLLSAKKYYQVDCGSLKYKVLTYIFHKEPMGRDEGEHSEPVNKNWRYPEPNSFNEQLNEFICQVS